MKCSPYVVLNPKMPRSAGRCRYLEVAVLITGRSPCIHRGIEVVPRHSPSANFADASAHSENIYDLTNEVTELEKLITRSEIISCILLVMIEFRTGTVWQRCYGSQ